MISILPAVNFRTIVPFGNAASRNKDLDRRRYTSNLGSTPQIRFHTVSTFLQLDARQSLLAAASKKTSFNTLQASIPTLSQLPNHLHPRHPSPKSAEQKSNQIPKCQGNKKIRSTSQVPLWRAPQLCRLLLRSTSSLPSDLKAGSPISRS